ncbi:hypothetical protein EG329_005401 [Mollisiaceae sp. DMI_Dod_QoI]|nr:hypothetical protein EG329_005401 [Helotiales sp. DMI_Dod_QoI]
MDRKDNRSPSPRRLSTLPEITEPSNSLYDPDTRSLRTLSTTPFPPHPTDNPNIPKNTVYINEVPQVISMFRPPRETTFQRYKKKWWFWLAVVLITVLICLVILTTVITLWNMSHKATGKDMVDGGVYTTKKHSSTTSAYQDGSTATGPRNTSSGSQGYTSEPYSQSAAPTLTGGSGPASTGSQACATGPCVSTLGPSLPGNSINSVEIIVVNSSIAVAASISEKDNVVVALTSEPLKSLEKSHSGSDSPTIASAASTPTLHGRSPTGTSSVFEGKAAKFWIGKPLIGIMLCWIGICFSGAWA